LLAFVVLGLVSSVSSQEIGRESEMTYYPILCQVGHETLTQWISQSVNQSHLDVVKGLIPFMDLAYILPIRGSGMTRCTDCIRFVFHDSSKKQRRSKHGRRRQDEEI